MKNEVSLHLKYLRYLRRIIKFYHIKKQMQDVLNEL